MKIFKPKDPTAKEKEIARLFEELSTTSPEDPEYTIHDSAADSACARNPKPSAAFTPMIETVAVSCPKPGFRGRWHGGCLWERHDSGHHPHSTACAATGAAGDACARQGGRRDRRDAALDPGLSPRGLHQGAARRPLGLNTRQTHPFPAPSRLSSGS